MIDCIFGLIYDSHRVYIPSTSDKILLDSATGLADKIRKKQLKAEAVVSAYIERIKAVNGILNAVVSERFAEALEEAKQIDKDIEEGKITEEDFKQKPFLGNYVINEMAAPIAKTKQAFFTCLPRLTC